MIIRLRNEQQKETAQAKQQVQNQQNTSMPTTTTTSTTTATTTASSIQTTSTKQSPSLPVQMTEQTTSAEQKDPYDCSTEEEDSDNDGDGTGSSVIKVDNKNDCIDESNKGMFLCIYQEFRHITFTNTVCSFLYVYYLPYPITFIYPDNGSLYRLDRFMKATRFNI